MAEGFFSRWSKRKEAVREGKPLEAEPPGQEAPKSSPAVGVVPPAVPEQEGRADGQAAESPAEPPALPTLEDVQALAPGDEVSRFVRPGVPLDVKNAAVKKLFADPHFNIMDGLDTYIDDYSKPDPMPPEMLRQLASAKFLKMFDDEEKQEEREKQENGEETGAAPAQAPTGREVADDPPAESVAQSDTAGPSDPAVHPPAEPHADPDLRLQQDDAPGPSGPGTRS